jgi:hypothetical protein
MSDIHDWFRMHSEGLTGIDDSTSGVEEGIPGDVSYKSFRILVGA